MTEDTLNRVHATLLERLEADASSSYVASLVAGGTDKILKKIAEEAAETIMATKDGVADKVIYEMADLWFHCMVLLAQQGLNPQQVIDELERRIGRSGLDEKAARESSN